MILDARSLPVSLSFVPGRVVSLVPSITETLFDAGAGSSVAGVTDFCIFPPAAREQALSVGGTKNPQVQAIRALAPDLVYMNFEENIRRHAEELGEWTTVVVTEPRTVDDVAQLIRLIGRVHQVGQTSETLVAALETERRGRRIDFTFACAIWKDPWMWCGGDTYISHLIEETGGRNVFAGEKRYPKASLDEAKTRGPEIIFLPDEPYVFTGGDAAECREVFGTRVIGPFPGHLVTWHGTRTILGLQFLRSQFSSSQNRLNFERSERND